MDSWVGRPTRQRAERACEGSSEQSEEWRWELVCCAGEEIHSSEESQDRMQLPKRKHLFQFWFCGISGPASKLCSKGYPQILCHLCRCLWNPGRLQVTLGAYIYLTVVLLWWCWLNAQLSCLILVLSEVYKGVCGVRRPRTSRRPVFFWSSSWKTGRILWHILGETWDTGLYAPELSPKHP